MDPGLVILYRDSGGETLHTFSPLPITGFGLWTLLGGVDVRNQDIGFQVCRWTLDKGADDCVLQPGEDLAFVFGEAVVADTHYAMIEGYYVLYT